MDDQDSYAALADELNDRDTRIICHRCNHEQLVKNTCEACGNDMDCLADFDEQYVIEGERFAKKHGLSWPPQVGDFDRYYDRLHNEGFTAN